MSESAPATAGRSRTLKERWQRLRQVQENPAGHKNMLLLIQLRWLAVLGQVSTIAFVVLVLEIHLPMPHMLEVLSCLIAFNIASHLRWHERRLVTNAELFLALMVDVGVLTLQLYLSGGITNPFAFLYLMQIILGAVLLKPWSSWAIVAITMACLAGLALFSEPLALPPDHRNGLFSLYVEGTLICFLLNAGLMVFFITRINSNLRAGDALLADLRQRAAEEDHIVRMGLLASGAAHELGTPLATVSVILGDWRRMPEISQRAELLDDITEMEAQLQRCKAIVSGVLLSAGEARGEFSVKTTLNTFLDTVAEDWRQSRPVEQFDYRNQVEQDVPVAFDSAIKQMLGNVLDNAFEVSPQWLALDVRCEGDLLLMEVSDRGPGFPEWMINQIGKPYQSTKGKPGRGLGLFFVVNVARKLGGSIRARNLAQGGAVVRLTLPLSAISLAPPADPAGPTEASSPPA
ncbi:ATP-binding protein [Herbaspirillum sp. alder98]|uniref:ATP-binding protein n=1 Tax=Herbaspirillum sp. alder98 TaxID=2913096 RepID=UPI001CD899D8|nr:ATP-binding protein [Herbaspirillum sp. alder98]MCA1323849.1 sensor histidine kinase [Herbaspirillum sp. alder98]